MTPITIPRKLIGKDDLVIIPRKEYEAFLQLSKKPVEKSRSQLDTDLDEAIAEYRAGKFHGPFNNVKSLMKSLKSKR